MMICLMGDIGTHRFGLTQRPSPEYAKIDCV
jgi:hypothetical protein